MRFLLFSGCLTITALGACGSDAAGGVQPFQSPWGNPGSRSVVCGPGTYLAGQECRADQSPAAGDGDGGGSSLPGDGGAEALDAGRNAGAALDSGTSIDIATACLVDDNKLVIAGDDSIHEGAPVVIEGGTGWNVHLWGSLDGLPSYLDVSYDTQAPDFTDWHIELSTRPLDAGLAKGTYSDAQRAAFAESGHPGLDVYGNGAGCNEVRGKFTVVDIQVGPEDLDAGSGDAGSSADGGAALALKSLTATFEQHCDGGSRFNVGCVHVVGSWPLP
jgi:hypothetical protein